MAECKPECVYCGSKKQTTDDHVPPKNLFPKPRPSNLITVPCCRRCNNMASKDDEYFRSMLAMRIDAGEHPEVQKVLPIVFRSLRRPQASGFTRKLIQNVTPIDVQTPAGIIVGRVGGYAVENERLERVVARTVRGIYWHSYGVRLPGNYEANCYEQSHLLDSCDQDVLQEFAENFTPMFGKPPDAVIGNRVFEYWHRCDVNDKYKSAWILRFYGSVCYYCITWPRT